MDIKPKWLRGKADTGEGTLWRGGKLCLGSVRYMIGSFDGPDGLVRQHGFVEAETASILENASRAIPLVLVTQDGRQLPVSIEVKVGATTGNIDILDEQLSMAEWWERKVRNALR